MQIGKFPFTKIDDSPFGEIYRPYVIVHMYTKKKKDWLISNMIADFGADYTLLPKKYATTLGIDLAEDCIVSTTVGVGGSETVYLYNNLLIKIGQWQEKIPVGFLERDDIPPLLGRLKCMEILKVTFENRITTLEK